VTDRHPTTLKALLANDFEYNIFERIKAGEWMIKDRHSGRIIDCPLELSELGWLSLICGSLIPGTAAWQAAKAKADEYEMAHYHELLEWNQLHTPLNHEKSEYLKTYFADAVFIAPLPRNPQEAAIFKALSGTAGITFMGVPNLQFQGRFDSGEWKSEWSTLGPEERAKLRDRLGMELSAWRAQLQDLLNREAAVHLENLNASEGSMAGVRALWTSEPIAQKQIEAEQRIALLERQIRFLTPSVALPDATPGRLKDGGQMQFPEWVSAEKLIKDGTFTKEQLIEFALSGVFAYSSTGEPLNLLLPILLAAKTLVNLETSRYPNLIKDLVQELHKTITTSEDSNCEEALRCMKLATLLEKSDRLSPLDESLIWEEIFQSHFKNEDVDRYLTPAEVIPETDNPENYDVRVLLKKYRELEQHYFGEGFEQDSKDEDEAHEMETARLRKENATKDAENKKIREQNEALEHTVIELQKQKPATEKIESGISRKTDYRTEQWKKAIPIAMALWKDNPAITLAEIKSDPPFSACFEKSGRPGDAQIRRKFHEAGIKLKSGKRKKNM
jgi:hypothetical protein